MEKISFSLPEKQKSKSNSERASLIEVFLNRINTGRPCTYEHEGKIKTLKPLTARAVAVRVGYLKKLSDLYFLDATCKQSKDYVKSWFFLTKSKKA